MKLKIIILIMLVIGAATYLWHNLRPSSDLQTHALKHLSTYHCPMHPSYTSDKPGQCPICGMDLVPVDAGDSSPMPQNDTKTDRANITIPTGRQQLIGVKTATIKKAHAIKEIRTVASAASNPELAVAQREYIEAKKVGDAALIKASHNRLILLGMNDLEVARLKNVQQGLYLPNDNSLVYPIIYEYELPYVKTGQEVILKLVGGGEAKGTVRSIDTVIDPNTRTARLHVETSGKKLNPNAFGTAKILIDLGEKVLVPKSAVITTGDRNIVFMVHEGTHFMPMDVRIGAELDDDYVVEDGLSEGDTVVTSANFLIDSESRLKAAIGTAGDGGHKH